MNQQRIQRELPRQKERSRPNLTGIPTQVKTEFEARSGQSLDHVRVHYNSDKPAKLGALAYAQGDHIYLGPNQQRHLRHELIHHEYQQLGLVRPTAYRGGVAFNTQPAMERAADLELHPRPGPARPVPVVQMVINPYNVRYWFKCSGIPQNPTPNAPVFNPPSPISGASRGGRVFLTKLSTYNPPVNLTDMWDWVNYLSPDEETVNLLQDPQMNQTLTRMHVINGRFWGPTASYNMVLGSHQDNQTHYREIESQIYEFLRWNNFPDQGDTPVGVSYSVYPSYFRVPTYIYSRFPQVWDVDYAEFRRWVASACPQNLHCSATFYLRGVDPKAKPNEDGSPPFALYSSGQQFASIPINF